MADMYEVPIIVGIAAASREEAEDAAGDVADALADVFENVESATAVMLASDDHYDMLGIKRGGESA